MRRYASRARMGVPAQCQQRRVAANGASASVTGESETCTPLSPSSPSPPHPRRVRTPLKRRLGFAIASTHGPLRFVNDGGREESVGDRSLLLLLTDLVALGAVHESSGSALRSPEPTLRVLTHAISSYSVEQHNRSSGGDLLGMLANASPSHVHAPEEWILAMQKALPDTCPTSSSVAHALSPLCRIVLEHLPRPHRSLWSSVATSAALGVSPSRQWYAVAEATRSNTAAGLLFHTLVQSSFTKSPRVSDGDRCLLLAGLVGLLHDCQTRDTHVSGGTNISLVDAIANSIITVYEELLSSADPLCRTSRIQSATCLLAQPRMQEGGREAVGIIPVSRHFPPAFMRRVQLDLLAPVPLASSPYSRPSDSSAFGELLQVLATLDGLAPFPMIVGRRWGDAVCQAALALLSLPGCRRAPPHQDPRVGTPQFNFANTDTSTLMRTAQLLLTIQPWVAGPSACRATHSTHDAHQLLSAVVNALRTASSSGLDTNGEFGAHVDWRLAMSFLSVHSQVTKSALVLTSSSSRAATAGLPPHHAPHYSCDHVVRILQAASGDTYIEAPEAVGWWVHQALVGLGRRPDLREAAALGRYCQQVDILATVARQARKHHGDGKGGLLQTSADSTVAVTFPEALTKLSRAVNAASFRLSTGLLQDANGQQASPMRRFVRDVGSVLAPQYGGCVPGAPWYRSLLELAKIIPIGESSRSIDAAGLLAPLILHRLVYHPRQSDLDLTRPRQVQQAAVALVQNALQSVSAQAASIVSGTASPTTVTSNGGGDDVVFPPLMGALLPLYAVCCERAPSSWLEQEHPTSLALPIPERVGNRLMELAVVRGEIDAGRQALEILQSTVRRRESAQPLSAGTRAVATFLEEALRPESFTKEAPTVTSEGATAGSVPNVDDHFSTKVASSVLAKESTAGATDVCDGAEMPTAAKCGVTPLDTLYKEAEGCLREVRRAQVRSLNLGSACDDGQLDAVELRGAASTRASNRSTTLVGVRSTWVRSMEHLASARSVLPTPNSPPPASMVAVALQCTLHACQWAVAASIWRHVHAMPPVASPPPKGGHPSNPSLGTFLTYDAKVGLALLRQQVQQARADEERCRHLAMASAGGTSAQVRSGDDGAFSAYSGSSLAGAPALRLFSGFGTLVSDDASSSAPVGPASVEEESRALALVADLTMRTFVLAEAWDDAVRYFHTIAVDRAAQPVTPLPSATTVASNSRNSSKAVVLSVSRGGGVRSLRPHASSPLFPSRHVSLRPGSIAVEAALVACAFASAEAKRLADDVRCIAGVLEDMVSIGAKLMVHVRRVFANRTDELESLRDGDGLDYHRNLYSDDDGDLRGTYIGGRSGGRTRSLGTHSQRSRNQCLPDAQPFQSPSNAPQQSDGPAMSEINLDDDEDFFVPAAGHLTLLHSTNESGNPRRD